MTFRNDLRWQEISASLRGGNLYVKMPISRSTLLFTALLEHAAQYPSSPFTAQWVEMATFLKEEARTAERAHASSVVLSFSKDVARKDLEALLGLDLCQDPSLLQYREVLEKGLRGDADVDWIHRCGGPSPIKGPLGLVEKALPPVSDLPDLSG